MNLFAFFENKFKPYVTRAFMHLLLCFACMSYLDVAQERTHNALIAGVENFKSSSLKRTDTKEKIVLPNAQGKIYGILYVFFKWIVV